MNRLSVGVISEINFCFTEICNILVLLFKFLEIQDHFPIQYISQIPFRLKPLNLCYMTKYGEISRIKSETLEI